MTQWEPPAPQDRVYVVGDIHGCADQLWTLLDRIDDDIARDPGPAGAVVFVGDYVDRGPASADVLRFMAQATTDHPGLLVGLMGNHERMLLDFLAEPAGPARRWLRHGGLQTMESFGIGLDLSGAPAALETAAQDLRAAMGPDLVAWIAALPTAWRSGTVWVTHAGADPGLPMPDQPPEVLTWGTPAFLAEERRDGQWIAFGHQPFAAPFARAGRIAVDTGAVYGGVLSAARIDPDGTTVFLSV